ncbi:uncharacterized protein DS421_9g262870 [Arachis hypogaea]|nr:uncharacterized protein DS421_9g262870 [Arachis hypogaea]
MTGEGATTDEEGTNCKGAMTDELATMGRRDDGEDDGLPVGCCGLAVVMERLCRSATVHVSERTGAEGDLRLRGFRCEL